MNRETLKDLKEGDWVIIRGENCMIHDITPKRIYYAHDYKGLSVLEDYKLWTPIIGEVVVFCDDNIGLHYEISLYVGKSQGGMYLSNFNSFKYIKPIEFLKEIIKKVGNER